MLMAKFNCSIEWIKKCRVSLISKKKSFFSAHSRDSIRRVLLTSEILIWRYRGDKRALFFHCSHVVQIRKPTLAEKQATIKKPNGASITFVGETNNCALLHFYFPCIWSKKITSIGRDQTTNYAFLRSTNARSNGVSSKTCGLNARLKSQILQRLFLIERKDTNSYEDEKGRIFISYV